MASTPPPRAPRVAAAPTRVTGTVPGPGVTATSPTQHPEVNIIVNIFQLFRTVAYFQVEDYDGTIGHILSVVCAVYDC